MNVTLSGRSTAFGCVLLCSLIWSCSDDQQQASRGMSAPGSSSGASSSGPVALKVNDALSFKDDDFVESEHNRDPFRSYSASFSKRGPDAPQSSQRAVIMPETALEEMKLIAVISGLSRPKAMLTDKHNVGYVVQRGDYIGRPKFIQTAGSVAITMNWRVDRIRETELVLTLQDPQNLSALPLSRIIGMRDEIAAR
jgi:type IV pilus assembly protein PilP